MEPGQFSDVTCNLPGYKRIWFRWTMTAATTFTINRSQELLAGTAGIQRTGVGVYDLFPSGGKAVELVDWWFEAVEAAPANTSAGSGKATVVNNMVASSKITVTFRRNSDYAATDFANTDSVYGYIGVQTIQGP